eukprot:scaffold99153_cov26-Cyclotella_meneghiniana.AAC.1
MPDTPKQPVGTGDNGNEDVEGTHPKSLPEIEQKQNGCEAMPLGYDMPDEDVFKRASKEDCAICCLELPNIGFEKLRNYHPCCGKIICIGCMYEVTIKGNHCCPFCRNNIMDGLFIEKLKKRVALGDSTAIFNLGIEYYKGRCIKKDFSKALKLFHQAAELGNVNAHGFLGTIYDKGLAGVTISKAKANHHMLAAAMGGHATCRHNVANTDFLNGHIDRAIKHYLIAASDGMEPSLKALQTAYSHGIAQKDDYAKALRAYQAYLSAIQSSQRDESLRFYNRFIG